MSKITPNDPGMSMPGWKKVSFIDRVYVRNYRRLGGSVAFNITEGEQLYSFTCEKTQQSCEQTDNAYTHSIEVQVGVRARNYEPLFDTISTKSLIVMLTDYNGVDWVAGSPDEPLAMTWREADSGSGEANPAILTFSGETQDPLLKRLLP